MFWYSVKNTASYRKISHMTYVYICISHKKKKQYTFLRVSKKLGGNYVSIFDVIKHSAYISKPISL